MVHPQEVDVIVCGWERHPIRFVRRLLTRNCSGGPAGSVVAGRLAYADPNLKVMLIEGRTAC
ncbi:hypothetical protein J3R83DRAFT_8394 [Lanmaoa asiatica]|nr:hypothetical protein J3R83DRAFT_8394 [Lanmaoa asiatica]